LDGWNSYADALLNDADPHFYEALKDTFWAGVIYHHLQVMKCANDSDVALSQAIRDEIEAYMVEMFQNKLKVQ
jgi:hypothetical protein